MNDKKFVNWSINIIDTWQTVSPALTIKNDVFTIVNEDKEYSASYFCGEYKNADDTKEYEFTLKYKISGKSGKAYAVIYQLDKNAQMLGADYLLPSAENTLSLKIELVPGTVSFKCELLFYSFGRGKVSFSDFNIIEREKKPHRIVNVATSFFSRRWHDNCEENFVHIADILDKAGKYPLKPDILCFTETVYDRGVLGTAMNYAIPDTHKSVKFVSEKAKEYNMHIIYSYHENENGKIYNSCVVISPEGEIVGKVRKTHLCYGEIKSGMIPGRSLDVVELPFGKIGILICWDQWFPEAARELVSKGAEIIFISTAGNPECISKARSRENGVYVVAAGCTDTKPDSSFITNNYGEIIASVSGEADITCVPIDLDKREYTRWLSFDWGFGKNLYPKDRRDDLYTYYKNGGNENG